MTNLSYITEYVTVVKDLVLTIAPVVGAYAAIKGLSTWNRQLEGSVKYKLTRRILKKTYRLREAIKGVRNPVMLAAEMPSPSSDEAATMTKDQIRFFGISSAYQKRWDKVTEARAGLHTELLEAEVVLHREVQKQFDPVFKLQQEMWIAVDSYVYACNPDSSESMRDGMNKTMRKNRDILYEIPGEAKDEFSNDVAKAISSIESFLKPHLGKLRSDDLSVVSQRFSKERELLMLAFRKFVGPGWRK